MVGAGHDDAGGRERMAGISADGGAGVMVGAKIVEKEMELRRISQ
jgi:hypothetical protein